MLQTHIGYWPNGLMTTKVDSRWLCIVSDGNYKAYSQELENFLAGDRQIQVRARQSGFCYRGW